MQHVSKNMAAAGQPQSHPGMLGMATTAAAGASRASAVALRLLPGEQELFRAKEIDICGEACTLCHGMDTIVVTDQRILYQWKRLACGIPLHSSEEAFYHEDMQWVWVGRVTPWSWAYMALLLFVVSIALLTASSGNGGMIAGGVILLILTFICVVIWLLKFFRRGVDLHVNFSRKDVGIADWWKFSAWKPHHSSTKRKISLGKPEAFEAYHMLFGILHSRKAAVVGVANAPNMPAGPGAYTV